MAQLSPQLKQATPVVATHGEGVYLYDDAGNRHLDFTAGIGVTSTGHCHPKVVAAAQEQVGTLIHGQYTTIMHKPLQQLTARLGEVLPSGLDSLFFANSGSEAAEAALRLVRQATGRPNIVVFQGGFHGRTVAAASLTTSGTKFRAGFSPLMGGVVVSPFPNPSHYRAYGWDAEQATDFALRELDLVLQTQSNPADTAAFLVEPVLGEGGYIPGTERFFAGLRERADEHGILLVVDEVQTGFGRTGRFWGQEHFGLKPDVQMFAKGIASGFPISGIAASQEVMAKAWPGSQGGTYGANAVACAAALATLDVIKEEGLVANSAARGEQLKAGLQRIGQRHSQVIDVHGLGLMVSVEFADSAGNPDGAAAAAVHKKAAENGLLLLTNGMYGQNVRFIPALVVTEAQVDDALSIWEKTLDAVLG
ncbi:aspartate aminotransferase family protein [Nesterenkonia alkaliphila]|uniref:(S)-3-amino-2-methylpropionate transaminase n=1 Tax=Nesterenkonia alkaliphila TaxID=1463631 RepID=A0A7K1UKD2_9MICC|nr:aminotransferase class III-fold pyridoxal phosphate-dependent enzyme [Nesterenkonia alkaliphila]MVT26929.1 aminotransferase class III-fold pyridoxal phosphate-dependent enzyme [Nesterenkonia alkaliphila]GFZ90555.1 aspartate aminotransferase family protein [Nesterenkonia alkaliphila]